MDRAKSITVDELSRAASAAARSVLGDDIKRFGKGASVGFFPHCGTVGIIWRDPDFGQFRAGELLDVSAKIAGEMRSIAGDAHVSAHIHPGGATAGYFPTGPILAEQLF